MCKLWREWLMCRTWRVLWMPVRRVLAMRSVWMMWTMRRVCRMWRLWRATVESVYRVE